MALRITFLGNRAKLSERILEEFGDNERYSARFVRLSTPSEYSLTYNEEIVKVLNTIRHEVGNADIVITNSLRYADIITYEAWVRGCVVYRTFGDSAFNHSEFGYQAKPKTCNLSILPLFAKSCKGCKDFESLALAIRKDMVAILEKRIEDEKSKLERMGKIGHGISILMRDGGMEKVEEFLCSLADSVNTDSRNDRVPEILHPVPSVHLPTTSKRWNFSRMVEERDEMRRKSGRKSEMPESVMHAILEARVREEKLSEKEDSNSADD